MQHSRIAAAVAVRAYRVVSLSRCFAAQRAFVAVPTGRPADPDVFSEERDRNLETTIPSGKPEETREKYEPDTAKRQVDAEAEHSPSNETEPFTSPKPPHASSPRRENVEIHNPAKTHVQQTRKNTTLTLEEVSCAGLSCAGLDGSPWPKGIKNNREQVEDNNEYYKHHKASPLSEIKVADTRKPITRATDGTADAVEYGLGKDVVGWRPEQLDTAEEALERARRIWRENAMRGDPDSPHGRVLRVLRGEWF
ncbi:hypothetical protein K2173_025483 [Erythroxylum novogranatense]|uniref:Uncharacterized protein n=1 Tax=Erythroxylum novogranatense TaxID=1862640 RepID=A0AAV8SBC5_9ROSI|nr:hypothetical protein K2173_025483 [Erythroxylum novogranatense]